MTNHDSVPFRVPTPVGTLLLTLIMACSTSAPAPATTHGAAITVWNQAYQENTQADTLAMITAQARDGYVLIDPFMDEVRPDVAATVGRIQANGNQVSAYISIGTGEDWRDDFAALQPYLVSQQWGEWPGEYFVSNPNEAVVAVMTARIDQVASWGFEWVEFDNMDWASDDDTRADYQIAATHADSVAYYRALCDYVRQQGMRCMAKSTVEGADLFDGVTYESYPDEQNWWDHGGASQFISDGKLVVVVHYDEADCAGVLADYQAIYGPSLSFICEDPAANGYVHF